MIFSRSYKNQKCKMKRLNFIILFLVSSIAFAQSPVLPGSQLEKIAGGFKFVECPLRKDSVGLFFSDLNGDILYKWNKNNGAVPSQNPSFNSNELNIDRRTIFTANEKSCGK